MKKYKMENLEVEIEIRKNITVNVCPREVLFAINDLPIGQKWGAVSTILDGINLVEELSDSQKEIFQKWIKKQCDKFNIVVQS